jgi:ribonuclease Z
MGKVIVLGSGYAVPEEGHENTHLLIEEGNQHILVDCATSPLIRLKKAGLGYDQVTDLILTHFHPDHVAGVPGFLVESWLLGRKHPLNVYGLAHTIDRVETMMGLYDWKKWPNFFPVVFHRLPEMDMSLVYQSPSLKIFASPVKHLTPTIGLRVEFIQEEKVVTYSCDTEPCPSLFDLAHHANVLIHEAAGGSVGHSSAAQAGYTARQAEVGQLYLIHYPNKPNGQSVLVEEAAKIFGGKVELAVDGMVLDF